MRYPRRVYLAQTAARFKILRCSGVRNFWNGPGSSDH